jgi:hypothetical protein
MALSDSRRPGPDRPSLPGRGRPKAEAALAAITRRHRQLVVVVERESLLGYLESAVRVAGEQARVAGGLSASSAARGPHAPASTARFRDKISGQNSIGSLSPPKEKPSIWRAFLR